MCERERQLKPIGPACRSLEAMSIRLALTTRAFSGEEMVANRPHLIRTVFGEGENVEVLGDQVSLFGTRRCSAMMPEIPSRHHNNYLLHRFTLSNLTIRKTYTIF